MKQNSNLNNIFNNDYEIKLPILGLGCGVIGLSYSKFNVNMGKIASSLLKSLEYRGYDSTGAAIQDDKGVVTLKKDVGAPSKLVKTLGIERMKGKTFCGQVRWATFGAVTEDNAQPHIVRCKEFIYGAHNGNITNTNELKRFLTQEGHIVVSDNDGEMLVHVIEHYFSLNLDKYSVEDRKTDFDIRRAAMSDAIIKASEKVVGSYAAVIVDPVTEFVYAIKAGSSLYVGIGEDEDDTNNKFILTSSDLSSILKFTKKMINIREGSFIEFKDSSYKVIAFKDMKIIDKKTLSVTNYKKGDLLTVPITRSKLRSVDTELNEPFKFYMHQEIYNQVESAEKIITFFNKGNQTTRDIDSLLAKIKVKDEVLEVAKKIYSNDDYSEQQKFFIEFRESKTYLKILKALKENFPSLISSIAKPDFVDRQFFSSHANIFLDIITGKEYMDNNLLLAKIFDVGSELREIKRFHEYTNNFVDTIMDAWTNHSSIYTISCGTSYNATKTAALFFNEIAGIKLNPILPGNFRGQYSNAIRDNDVLIGVSQSGETKDLIDIFNDVDASGKKVRKITIVNNENSTLAQEKSEFYLPIKCGPEISVPATKSYMNQVILFYFLAIKIGEKKLEGLKDVEGKEDEYKLLKESIEKRFESLSNIPELIDQTIKSTGPSIANLAELLFLEPSLHILATKVSSVAEEGALKIRETVLNHTQGIEASEFKHGPNTILGFNTIFGTLDMEYFIRFNQNVSTYALKRAQEEKLPEKETQRLLSDLTEYTLKPVKPFNISPKAYKIFKETINKFNFTDNLDTNYPLIFLTGPDERDVNLTISQINTHKIRGANIFVIAEGNEQLYNNTISIPAGDDKYKYEFIKLPKTDDTLLSTFSSMVVLQLLAFKMSLKKMKYLNKLHVPLHGVHPDVPKNVSKSITVD